jgi:FMN reductase (NADPH)/FMN reductase [NAD(P)H]
VGYALGAIENRHSKEMVDLNPTIKLMNARCSTRSYSEEPLTSEERQAVLHTAMRAPTAGNLMLYSIIEVEDQALKERLAVTCDNQPFIAKAPWVLIFVADYQKWIDLFAHCGADTMEGVEHRGAPGPGDLLLACSDALIAAQNAVIAAESLGIGSCYIGDILENAEEHQQLLELPPHTLPVAMLCFGRPKKERTCVARQERHVVMRDRYHRLAAAEMDAVSRALESEYAPHGLPSGTANYPQAVYKRKFTAAFSAEMNRSAQWWIERWQGRS